MKRDVFGCLPATTKTLVSTRAEVETFWKRVRVESIATRQTDGRTARAERDPRPKGTRAACPNSSRTHDGRTPRGGRGFVDRDNIDVRITTRARDELVTRPRRP